MYPGALAKVPRTSPARVLWETYVAPEVKEDVDEASSDSGEEAPAPVASNKFDEHVNSVIAQGIKMRTSAEAIASGQRAARAPTKAAKKKEPFKGVSVYHTLFPGTSIKIK